MEVKKPVLPEDKKDLLSGERIWLRPMEFKDTERIICWRNREFVRRNFIYQKPFTPEGHRQWIETAINTGRAVQFIMMEKGTDRPVGSVYFRDINKEHGKAEFGIFIGEEDAMSKGYGTEGAHLALSYAFQVMKLHKVMLRVLSDNRSAVRSYEKAGFVREAYLKEEVCLNGRCRDMILMGFLNPQKEKGMVQKNMRKQTVSFVIPCYRSANTLEGVVNEIREAMSGLKEYHYEIILVNDSSPDHTFEVIRSLCESHDNILGINLARNFGQHAALMAGLRHVRGDIAVCLDDDGQTPPLEVGKLLRGIQEGADVVYARYTHKRHSLFRRFGSSINEIMTRIMLEKPKELYLSSYFAVRAFVVEEMIRYEHSYPYVIGLVLRSTRNIVNVDVEHRERTDGASGYSLKKLLGLWFNGFTAFSVKPLRLATGAGALFACVGFLYGVYTIIKKIFIQPPELVVGFSALMSGMMFIGGMMMLMLGLIGEYIGRMYISMNQSPQYVIRETVGRKETDTD